MTGGRFRLMPENGEGRALMPHPADIEACAERKRVPTLAGKAAFSAPEKSELLLIRQENSGPVTPKVAGSSPVAPASKINILAHLFARLRFSTPPNGSLGSSERPCSELFLSTRSFHACNLAAGIRMRSGRAEAARILHSEVRCRGGYRDHAHRLACAVLCTALRDRSQVSSANPLEIGGKSARSRLARNRRMGGMFLR